MTIYKDTELKAYLEQAGFHEVQIHKKERLALRLSAEMREKQTDEGQEAPIRPQIALTTEKSPLPSMSVRSVSSTYWYVPLQYGYRLPVFECGCQLFQVTVRVVDLERPKYNCSAQAMLRSLSTSSL